MIPRPYYAPLIGLLCFLFVCLVGLSGVRYRNAEFIPRSLIATIRNTPQQNLVKPDQLPRPVQRVPKQPVPILMYHYVRSVSQPEDPLGYDLSIEPTDFANQLDAIKAAGYQTITPSQYVLGDIPEKSIILSFDDGYADFYQSAFPLLAKRKMTAVVFVVSGFLDDESGRYLTRTQVRSLSEQGIEIGSHTVSHLNLVTAEPRRRQDELLVSRLVLEQLISKRVLAVAYPAGKTDEIVARIADYVGYTFGVTTHPGAALPSTNRLLLPRVRVRGGESVEALIASIERARNGSALEQDADNSDPLSSEAESAE